MELCRPPLESWFNKHQPGSKFDLGGTMIPAPLALLQAIFQRDMLEVSYSPTTGSADLRLLLAEVEVLEPEDLFLTCGATAANTAALLAALRPGGAVVLQDPIYYQFEPWLLAHGIEIRHWRLPNESACHFPPAVGVTVSDEPPIDPRTCLVILNSPHNPTGRVLSLEPIVHMIESLPDAYLLVDEVYRGVSPDGLATAALLSKRVVVTNSFAKRWGMPGLRLGWLACRDHVFLERALAWHEHLAHSPPRTSERMVVALWPELQVQLKESQRIAARNAALFSGWLVQVHGHCRGRLPRAGVTTLLHWPGLARHDDVALALHLRRQSGLFVVPGTFLGFPGTIRIGFGQRDPAELLAALAILETRVPVGTS
ncbi:MAG: pyridoxal phosphate-dependent aminotransferase [Cyanobacteria bacterium NC_groundwater_1444_Ag_S-0.65um_54_12]|nr:pyridoxal phosphate-dependent aminotransferase [Cyanobacteria bacterium NC_groundwater_1444_Ag_S-0.65um_54_12]